MHQLSLWRSILVPAAKSCSVEGATGRHLQQATAIFSPHSPPSCLPFHCLPAASPHSFLPYLFRPLFSSLSPSFIFMLSHCLLWKLLQHPLLDRHTHCTQLDSTHKAHQCTKWLTRKGPRKKRWHFLYLWVTRAIIVFWASIRAIKLQSSCSLWYI